MTRYVASLVSPMWKKHGGQLSLNKIAEKLSVSKPQVFDLIEHGKGYGKVFERAVAAYFFEGSTDDLYKSAEAWAVEHPAPPKVELDPEAAAFVATVEDIPSLHGWLINDRPTFKVSEIVIAVNAWRKARSRSWKTGEPDRGWTAWVEGVVGGRLKGGTAGAGAIEQSQLAELGTVPGKAALGKKRKR